MKDIFGKKIFFAGILLILVLPPAPLTWAEAPAGRAQVDGIDLPKGPAHDSYIVYHDFYIPVVYFNDQEFPGHVKIIDKDSVLWVAKREDLSRLLEKILPLELKRVLEEADKLYDQHLPDQALREYQRVLTLLPGNPYIHLRIGQCHAVMHDYQKAREAFDQSLKLSPKNHQAINERGLLAYRDGRFVDALNLFTQAFAMQRSETYKHNMTEVMLTMADNNLADNNYDAALGLLEKVMAMVPDYAGEETPPREASIFHRYLEVSQQKELAAKLPQRTEQDLWVRSGERLIHGKLWREAITLFRTLYEEEKTNENYKDHLTRSFLGAGNELFSENKWDEAVAVYQDAKQYIPVEKLQEQAMLKAFLKTGTELFRKKDWEKAIDPLGRLFKIFPENKDVKTLLADSHYYLAKEFASDPNYQYPEALEHATSADQVYPKDKYKILRADLLIEMGRLHASAGKWDDAIKRFREAYQAAPVYAPIYYSARSLYFTAFIRRFFAEQFLIALVLTTIAGAALMGILRILNNARRAKKMLELLRQAETAFAQKNWSETLAFYDSYRSVAKRATPLAVFERMAQCYIELGEFNNALLTYNRAEELLSGERRFTLEKAKIFARKGNAELTAQIIKEQEDVQETSNTLLEFCKDLILREKNSQNKARYREVVGGIHMVRGEISTAKAIFEDLHRDYPRALYPLRKLIEIAKKENKPQRLKEYLEQYLESDQTNASIISDLAEYYESIGRKQEAIDRYAEAYDLAPVDRIRARIQSLARNIFQGFASTDADTLSVGVSGPESLKSIVDILLKIKDFQTALEIIQGLAKAGLNDPWLTLSMADCFSALLVDDMAIKHYRRYLDQYRKSGVGTTLDETEKSVMYNLAKAYERKGLNDLALKEYQMIYEQDIKYKDIALKIPVLYEKKMREEKTLSEESHVVVARPLSKPKTGEVRCPKCLNPIPNEAVYCPFCNCKVGFTPEEIAQQNAKREARLSIDPAPQTLPPGDD